MPSRTEFIVGPSRFPSARSPTPPLPPRRRPEGASGEATLRWGGPSGFQFASTSANSVFVTQSAYDELPADDEQAELLFTETGRVTTTVRIENSSDSSHFVDVERIDRISFKGPDGVVRTFVLSN